MGPPTLKVSTGRLLALDILHGVGRSIHPALDLGQVEGAARDTACWGPKPVYLRGPAFTSKLALPKLFCQMKNPTRAGLAPLSTGNLSTLSACTV